LFDTPTHQVLKPNDSTTGQQLKEKGIKEVSEHNENWMKRAILGARTYITYPATFTGENIRNYIEQWVGAPKHPNAYGALINTLIKRKIIVPTGEHRKMKDIRSHARSTPVYKAV
jgi:hypothetical protein